jgi:hypothetical protein
MTCEPCISLPGQEVDSLQTSSLDTRQLSLLNGMDTPAKSSGNEPQMVGSLSCECGKETSGCSIHPNTPEAWIASMRDSLARILALPESKQGLAKKRAVASTVKSSASLAVLMKSEEGKGSQKQSYSLRTLQQSFLTDSEPSSLTLPRSGMTVNGYVYELPTVGSRITETDGGYWPTPNALPATNDLNLQCSGDRRTKPNKLGWAVAVNLYPTPCSRDYRSSMSMETVRRREQESSRGVNLSEFMQRMDGNNGKLNPSWVEWLMGWPIAWTGLKQSATVKSRSKRPSPGVCSEVSE